MCRHLERGGSGQKQQHNDTAAFFLLQCIYDSSSLKKAELRFSLLFALDGLHALSAPFIQKKICIRLARPITEDIRKYSRHTT